MLEFNMNCFLCPPGTLGPSPCCSPLPSSGRRWNYLSFPCTCYKCGQSLLPPRSSAPFLCHFPFSGQLVSQDCYEPGTTVHTSNLILRTGRWCAQGQSGLHSKSLFHKQQQENIKLLCWDFHCSLCLADLFLLSWAVLIWFSLVFRGKMGQVLFPKHAWHLH